MIYTSELQAQLLRANISEATYAAGDDGELDDIALHYIIAVGRLPIGTDLSTVDFSDADVDYPDEINFTDGQAVLTSLDFFGLGR